MLTLDSPILTFSQQAHAMLSLHWERFQTLQTSLESTAVISPETLSKTLYAKLMSGAYTRQKPAEALAFLSVIETAVAQQQPIPVILGHGPLKNMNNCQSPDVDWAEFFTLSHLVDLQMAIQALYPPGLTFTLFLDDARAEAANGVPACWTERYLDSLKRLIQGLGLETLIPQVVSFKEAYLQYGVEAHLPAAEQWVLQWELDPAHQEVMDAQTEHALRNLPKEYFPDAQHRYQQALAAAHRYRVYHHAEILAGIWSLPDTLYGRFSPHPGFWQLFTLKKGIVSQPWQGKGVLCLNAKGQLEPLLLTKSRKNRHEVLQTVDTQLPLEGFGQIEIWVEQAKPLDTMKSLAKLPVPSLLCESLFWMALQACS